MREGCDVLPRKEKKNNEARVRFERFLDGKDDGGGGDCCVVSRPVQPPRRESYMATDGSDERRITGPKTEKP